MEVNVTIFEREDEMFKFSGVKLLIFIAILIAAMTLSVYAATTSPISGRLAATYDNKTETVTAMVAGYCESQPVTIGPRTWTMTKRDFSHAKAEDIANILCGGDHNIRKVTKSSKSATEIVADVLIDRITP